MVIQYRQVSPYLYQRNEGGREGEKEGGKERDGGREGGREGRREGGSEGGREGGREGETHLLPNHRDLTPDVRPSEDEGGLLEVAPV